MPEEELAKRVARLERQVADLAKRSAYATAERVLAAGTDRDVAEVRAELRAPMGTLNALREGQVDLRDEMRRRFATVNTSLQQIVPLLETGGREDAEVAGREKMPPDGAGPATVRRRFAFD